MNFQQFIDIFSPDNSKKNKKSCKENGEDIFQKFMDRLDSHFDEKMTSIRIADFLKEEGKTIEDFIQDTQLLNAVLNLKHDKKN